MGTLSDNYERHPERIRPLDEIGRNEASCDCKMSPTSAVATILSQRD
jgi:hypothetical protein